MTHNYNTGYFSLNYAFLRMLEDIKDWGLEINTRNSLTRRITGMSIDFFQTPLISLRRTAWKNALREMEWFLSGSSNIKDLDPRVHSWWLPWADANGEIKNNYSKQFRRYENKGMVLDQVQMLIDAIKDHPFSRRSVITTWNTADMVSPETPITNCHGTIIQAFVDPAGGLELLMYQRSSDMLLGVPHNWIQYWAFLLWLCAQTDKFPRALRWVGGDCHVYKDHFSMIEEMRKAYDLNDAYVDTPDLIYKGLPGQPFKADDFQLENGTYKPLLDKKAKMVV